ncbi:MAG: hypothetical protein EZS28_009972 [Streblomastix strix]|uniref:Uncharacterized protein n=1 Tax=Streblomastix strix TaxID=222440 RepID=A0A5J4WHL8_9EUKA|nr:MAG: hypothetical protein EZS28_009972 [Streblomastix strix]
MQFESEDEENFPFYFIVRHFPFCSLARTLRKELLEGQLLVQFSLIRRSLAEILKMSKTGNRIRRDGQSNFPGAQIQAEMEDIDYQLKLKMERRAQRDQIQIKIQEGEFQHQKELEKARSVTGGRGSNNNQQASFSNTFPSRSHSHSPSSLSVSPSRLNKHFPKQGLVSEFGISEAMMCLKMLHLFQQ